MIKFFSHIIKRLQEKIDLLLSEVRSLREELSVREQILSNKDREIALLKSELERRKSSARKDSQTSSKPPSSDKGRGKRKGKNNRRPSDKKSGGQPGNSAKTLDQVSSPDKVELLSVDECSFCGTDLSKVLSDSVEKRQVFELMPSKLEVIEYQRERKLCPLCGEANKGSFPSGVTAPVQYGSGIRSKIVDLNVQHFLSYRRIQDLFQDWFSLRISGGLIYDSLQKGKQLLQQTYEPKVEALLLASLVVHADETGVYITGVSGSKRQWLHVLSTDKVTLYQAHPKRGQEAIEDWGLLPQYTGTLLHDGFKSYPIYEQCRHGLCHAHHLRELRFFEEEEQAIWAWQMSLFLCSTKRHRAQLLEEGKTTFAKLQLEQYRKRYFQIIEYGRAHAPPDPPRKSTRGKAPQHPQKNLLDRFLLQQEPMLLFLEDFKIPFDNNQAERDLRMSKTKQKVQGTFRSKKGADAFAVIKGYCSTAKKNGKSILKALKDLFEQKPFVPS